MRRAERGAVDPGARWWGPSGTDQGRQCTGGQGSVRKGPGSTGAPLPGLAPRPGHTVRRGGGGGTPQGEELIPPKTGQKGQAADESIATWTSETSTVLRCTVVADGGFPLSSHRGPVHKQCLTVALSTSSPLVAVSDEVMPPCAKNTGAPQHRPTQQGLSSASTSTQLHQTKATTAKQQKAFFCLERKESARGVCTTGLLFW